MDVTHLDRRQSTFPRRAVAALCLCVVLVTITLTWTYLGMRAVMDVGGSCAEGGPYVIARPCPDGTWMIAVAIPVMIIAAMAGSAVAISLSAPNLLLPRWAVLFASLGWNFLDFGAFSGELVWGWIVCGVVFELMALPAVLLLLPVNQEKWAAPGPRAPSAAVPGAGWWWPVYAALALVGFTLAVWSYAAWS